MESTCTAVYMSPNKWDTRRGNICFKVLVVEVQIVISSRFPATDFLYKRYFHFELKVLSVSKRGSNFLWNHHSCSSFCMAPLFRGVPLVLRWRPGVWGVTLFRHCSGVFHCSAGVPCSGVPGFIVYQ